MPAEISVRRSGRDRRPTTTYYDDAKHALEKRLRSNSPKKKGQATRKEHPSRHNKSQDIDDVQVSSSSETDEEDHPDDDDHDNDYNEESQTKTRRANTHAAKKYNPRKKQEKIVVQVGKSTLHSNKTNTSKKLRAPHVALHALAKKVIDKDEQQSLVAKLLLMTNMASLKTICGDVILLYRDNSNSCQVGLINFIFRVVGGSNLSALSDDTDLEEMGTDDWSNVITDVVDDMRYCAAEHVLISADPNGAAITKTTTNASSLGIREFRNVYQNFWYTLAEVALQDNPGRFEVEMLRDWLSRTHELTMVAQPDIRMAAIMASLQMSLAALQRTTMLQVKEMTSARLRKASTGKKADAFQYQLEALQRSRQDLEDVVDATFSTVFMNRYRDSNPFIRAESIAVLSKMTLLRPDIYLRDKYLKYVGWTLSDKEPCVRIASLSALSAPFLQKGTNLASMENVIRKFLPRIADCTIDIDVKVQEKAMALLLLLDRANFLEDFEDDYLWAQINNCALATDTSAVVRRDALQFILDQLEAFDYDETEGPTAMNWTKDKNASLVQSSSLTAAKQLSTLAGWIGHALTDGNIPLDQIRIELTDLVVDSLRALSEYQSLVTNWSSMMLAIKYCEYVPSSMRDKTDDRTEIARERVMVRILSRAARVEVHAVDPEFLQSGVDPALAEVEGLPTTKSKTKGKGNSHELLSSALLKSLPELFAKFKTDTDVLTSLSSLPRLILPSVMSLPQRKHDFFELIRTISEVFLCSSNETVLVNISEALAFFVSGHHARANDVEVQLRSLVTSLCQKLFSLFAGEPEIQNKKKKRKSRSLDSSQTDEVSISLCLRRLHIIAKRLDIRKFLNEPEQQEQMIKLRNSIVDGLSDRLEARQLSLSDDSLDATIKVPDVWNEFDADQHNAVSDSVRYALHFLLANLAWSLRDEISNDPVASAYVDAVHDEDMNDIDVHTLVEQRTQLVQFISLCFEQFLPEANENFYTVEQVQFAEKVQTAAFQASGDLRSLLPKGWADTSSPLLRACALVDDSTLIGGSMRFFRSREKQLRQVEDQECEDTDLVCALLLPFCRSFVANWSHSNRREAGYAMAHLVGSGQAAQQILSSMSRIVKRLDPIHLLETHMACLRTSFDDWLNSEPEDIESDRPTDEEMAAFDAAEIQHGEMFDLMVQLAGRLSQSLGVGKVDDILENPLLGFCKEGVRYAFSIEMPGSEPPLLPGGRLTFLSLLSKYIPWVRHHSSFSEMIVQNVIEREEDLKNDPDYLQIHQDDLDALAAFHRKIRSRVTQNTPSKSPRSVASVSQVSDGDESDVEKEIRGGKSIGVTDAVRSKRLRHSLGSSVGSSVRSASGNLSALSPLIEEGDESGEDSPLRGFRKRKHRKLDGSGVVYSDDEEDEGLDILKRKFGKNLRRSSVGSALSGTIQEEEDMVDSSSEES